VPAASVITPAFHAEQFIGRAVASVLRQTFEDLELLIVADDGKDYAAILSGMGVVDPRIRCLDSGGVVRGPILYTLDLDEPSLR
jgi:glycosyltransferase involved in cell wall biosynthesis